MNHVYMQGIILSMVIAAIDIIVLLLQVRQLATSRLSLDMGMNTIQRAWRTKRSGKQRQPPAR